MDIGSLHEAYRAGMTTAEQVVGEVYDRIGASGLRPVWISVVPREEAVGCAGELGAMDTAKLPLFGVPFAVKDNIDVAGMPTTAGCAEFAYTPRESATVVTRLQAAGAILIGKTNMDQFATGLVGTRTPFGVCSTVFDARHISGGSSAGSAVAVANGLVSFALGTDTAGSGRVPAMFNNLIGLKPTRGAVSAHGVVPACRTLDCVSIFAETAHDASLVLKAARGFDPLDAFSRKPRIGAGAAPWASAAAFRFGVPGEELLEFFGDTENAALYREAVARLAALGGSAVRFDLVPFLGAAQLLYKGPWVAERYAAIAPFFEKHKGVMDPTVATILGQAGNYSAADAFTAMYELQRLKRQTDAVWESVDVLCLPTAPRSYTIGEIEEAPVERNSHLGYYTNFVNLLDLSAVAVPAGMRTDGLPFGVSLVGQAFQEDGLLVLGDRLHRAYPAQLGGSARMLDQAGRLPVASPPPGCLLVAVVGAHLSGQPLNWQLTQRGGRLVRTCRTAAGYMFYALKGTIPAKPGLVRVPQFSGAGIEVEVWALPEDTVGSFVEGVPPPLCIGTLVLEDGSMVKGFLVEPAAVEDATDITALGGWRPYLRSGI